MSNLVFNFQAFWPSENLFIDIHEKETKKNLNISNAINRSKKPKYFEKLIIHIKTQYKNLVKMSSIRFYNYNKIRKSN